MLNTSPTNGGRIWQSSPGGGEAFPHRSPCLIVIFKEWWSQKEDGTRDKNYYVTESACLATGLLINALRNAGYASLTYTPAPPTFLRELLGRPEGETPIMVLCVGKPGPLL